MVIAKTSAKRVQSIVPNQREWLSVLVCVNAAGQSIPSFYIFRGKRFRTNYIQYCEAGATMAMQPRAWMTSYLFSAWISHFVASIRRHSLLSPEHRHLLILDGHNSHVTLEVARLAKTVGLDLITLPSHTSHALQPLDVAVFKPFKQFFREYRDYWMSRNLDQPASKEILAQWVSLALRKALSPSNIQAGFRGAGIFPLDRNAPSGYIAPSEIYRSPPGESGCRQDAQQPCSEPGAPEVTSEREEEADRILPNQSSDVDIAADLSRDPNVETEHFFVGVDPAEPTSPDEIGGLDPEVQAPDSITQFLQLPSFTPRANSRRRDPIVDYTKSVILTSAEYEDAAIAVQNQRENAIKEKERQKQEREELKKRKAAEREVANAQKVAERQEILRRKEQRQQEKDAAQARKAAEREEAARTKAQRALELAQARADKAAEKTRRFASKRPSSVSRAPQNVDACQDVDVGSHAFTQPPSPPSALGQFFFPSPTNIPSLSHIGMHSHSRTPFPQFPFVYQVPPIPAQHTHAWSAPIPGGMLPTEERAGSSSAPSRNRDRVAVE